VYVAPSTELYPIAATLASVAFGSFAIASRTVYNCKPIKEFFGLNAEGATINPAERTEVVFRKVRLVVIVFNFRL
jgi:hypothetical protein